MVGLGLARFRDGTARRSELLKLRDDVQIQITIDREAPDSIFLKFAARPIRISRNA
jgi:hypothetical protein